MFLFSRYITHYLQLYNQALMICSLSACISQSPSSQSSPMEVPAYSTTSICIIKSRSTGIPPPPSLYCSPMEIVPFYRYITTSIFILQSYGDCPVLPVHHPLYLYTAVLWRLSRSTGTSPPLSLYRSPKEIVPLCRYTTSSMVW